MSRHLSSSSFDELTELLAETQLAIRRICASPPESPLRCQLDSWQDLRRLVRQELQDRTAPSACPASTGSALESQKGMARP